jgi:Uma2 family endonuclease
MGEKKPATYEDLVALPFPYVGEIVGGELYASPRPAFAHTRAASVLGMKLGGPFDQGIDGPGGWLILFEPELHFGAEVLVPDFAAWRRERLPQALGPRTPYFTLAPDWVCEVVSPSTARLDRTRKKYCYAREGVKHFWILDALARTLETFRVEDGKWVDAGSYGGDERIRAEPFDAVELPLEALWVPGTGTETAD